MAINTFNPCPLCSNKNAQPFHRDADRDYLKCPNCDLVFAHSRHYLSREEEFKRYEFHENDPDDPAYRAFLNKLFEPMVERIPANSDGLDFGSGPGPLLKIMFEEQGHGMSVYDIYYAPETIVFDREYDFITSSEVVEHLYQPMAELDRLWSCLKSGGFLGIMTGIRKTDIDFPAWHYIRDETHVIFFSPATFEWLAKLWGANLEFVGNTVAIFQKAR